MPRKYDIDENVLDSKSEKQSYFLGYFAGDGNRRDNIVRITSGDKEAIQNLKECLSSEHPIKERTNRDNYYIDFGSKKLSQKLKNIGYATKKSNNLVYPDKILDRHFIRGFFDADGSVYYSKGYLNTSFVSNDASFLRNLKSVLENNADVSDKKVYLRENKGNELRYSHKDSFKIYSYIYPGKYFLDRKKSVFDNCDVKVNDLKWSDEEEEYLKNNYREKKDEELASDLGRSVDAVEAKRLKNGLLKYQKISDRDRDEQGRFL